MLIYPEFNSPPHHLIVGEVKNPEHFQYGEETMLAWRENRLNADLVEEHKKVTDADLIIFQVSYRFLFSVA